MLRKAFMTEADLEEVARLEAIRARAEERERRLAQGQCPGQFPAARQNSRGTAPQSADTEACPHCKTSH